MPDSITPVAAIPDGMTVAEAMEALQLGKTALYKRMGELGIKPTQQKGRAWLTTAQVEELRGYSRHRDAGLPASSALAAVGRGPLQVMPQAMATEPPEPPADAAEDQREALELLQLRLRALRDAVELGAPLTTREVAQLLGARPGEERVTRAGIEARKLARNLWQVRKVETGRGRL